jgi:hypothetical protein
VQKLLDTPSYDVDDDCNRNAADITSYRTELMICLLAHSWKEDNGNKVYREKQYVQKCNRKGQQ